MTDERHPEGQTSSSGDEPVPSSAAEPPPLAPLVEQAQSADAAQLDETTAQPTGSWAPAPPQAVPSSKPPAIPPPAVQPAVAWDRPPAQVAIAGRRTPLSAAAGIILLILGILGGLFGLAIAVLGRAIVRAIRDFGPIPEIEGMDAQTFLSGFVLFLGIIVVVYSLLYVFAGIGVLRSKDWGRVLGIIVGILSGLVWLGGLGGTRRTVGDDLVLAGILLAIHVYVVVALLFFWRSKPAPS